MTNSDILSNINYSKFFEYHINSNSDITVGVVPYYVNIPYGILEMDKNDKVENLIEKPSFKYFSNAGIYMIKRDLIKIVPKNKLFDATDIIKYCIDSNNLSVSKFEINNYWKDIGKIDDYKQAEIDFKEFLKMIEINFSLKNNLKLGENSLSALDQYIISKGYKNIGLIIDKAVKNNPYVLKFENQLKFWE